MRVIITAGSVADCTQAEGLIKGIQNAGSLIADKGYDTNQIEATAKNQGMEVVIPPRKNRINPRQYDEYLYRLRHLVENAFLKLKGWRAVATRYAKNAASYLAAVQIRCLYLWLAIS